MLDFPARAAGGTWKRGKDMDSKSPLETACMTFKAIPGSSDSWPGFTHEPDDDCTDGFGTYLLFYLQSVDHGR